MQCYWVHIRKREREVLVVTLLTYIPVPAPPSFCLRLSNICFFRSRSFFFFNVGDSTGLDGNAVLQMRKESWREKTRWAQSAVDVQSRFARTQREDNTEMGLFLSTLIQFAFVTKNTRVSSTEYDSRWTIYEVLTLLLSWWKDTSQVEEENNLWGNR